SFQYLDRTLNVRFQNNKQFLDLGKSERFDAAFRRLEHCGLTRLHLPLSGDGLCPIDVRYDLECITRVRNALKPEHFHRSSRRRFRSVPAAVGGPRAGLAVNLSAAARPAIAMMSRLTPGRRVGTASCVEFCFGHDAGCTRRRASLEFETVRLEQTCLQ